MGFTGFRALVVEFNEVGHKLREIHYAILSSRHILVGKDMFSLEDNNFATWYMLVNNLVILRRPGTL